MVTTDTAQTITALKTFTDPNETYAGSIKLGNNANYGAVKLTGDPIYNGYLRVALGDTNNLGEYTLHKNYLYFTPASGADAADLGTSSFK